MKKITALLMSVGLMLFLISGMLQAQEQMDSAKAKSAPEKPAHQYIGATACKPCHSTAKIGDQFKIWSDSKHANAYALLATPEADSVGKAHNIEKPQESPDCLVCHVTAYSAPAAAKAATFKPTEGVGCEACHGPGSDYKSMKVMKDREASIAAGLLIPNEKTCTKCHNEDSPTYKAFVYADYLKKIAHPIPKKPEAGETK